MSTALQIGRALKGRKSGDGWLVRCPCQNHGNGRGDRSPSLSIHDGDDGRLLLKCFAGCKFQDILASLRHLGLAGDLPQRDRARTALQRVDPRSEPHNPDQFAIQIWRDAKPANGTVVHDYLRGRAIPVVPPSIRRGEYLHLGRYPMPAMIAGVQRPDGAVVAVAQVIFKMPVWASLGCHRLYRVELPSLVQHVHVFGDNDAPGRSAAERAAQHHRSLSRRVTVHFPAGDFKDFNDFARANAGAPGAAA